MFCDFVILTKNVVAFCDCDYTNSYVKPHFFVIIKIIFVVCDCDFCDVCDIAHFGFVISCLLPG
jgi:hypothetical protein